MRVCHVAFSFYPGQGLTDLYENTTNEARLGVEVSVIAVGRPDEPLQQKFDGVEIIRVPVGSVSFGVEQPRWKLGDTLSFIQKVLTHIKIRGFDIIHVYAFSGAFLLPLLGRRIHQVKWLYNIRSGSVNSGKRARIENLSLAGQAHFFEAIFIISESVGRTVFGRMRPNIYIAPLGVNLELFKPLNQPQLRAQLGYSKNDFVLIYSGVLDKRRRLDALLYALKQARQQCPQLKLMVIGDGADKVNLVNLSRELGLEDAITFVGYISYQTVPAYLSVANIGVSYLPLDSGYYAQPPLKVVEYLGCGLPVIATDTAGHQCFIRDGYNGLLVNDTPQALAEALIRVVQDQTLFTQLRGQARPSALEHSWEQIVRFHLLPAYQKISRKLNSLFCLDKEIC